MYCLNWQLGGKKSWPKKRITDAALVKKLIEWVDRSEQNAWIMPQSLCAIFPCQSDGDSLIIYDIQDHEQEIARFNFSLVIRRGRDTVCPAQYFLSKQSGQYDIIGLQVATAGINVPIQVKTFQDQGDTESALFLQGLADRVAEDMAEYTHNFLRDKLNMGSNEGARYSPGYPALKDMSVNKIIFDLLQADKELGIQLTEAFEFNPTATTGAVVCFFKGC